MHSPKRKRILFLLRHRDLRFTDECYSYGTLTSGLLNSARLVADMLRDELRYEVKIVEVQDSNCVDREVTKFQPDFCIIEALWVPPAKFKQLHRLHPRVRFVVRLHSAMPFGAMEGQFIEWPLDSIKVPNVLLGCNDERTRKEFRALAHLAGIDPHKVVYLPNYYPAKLHPRTPKTDSTLDVGCFGAVRPLKNQLIQAVAAVAFAARNQRALRFHVNSTRLEQNAGPILKNLRSLFSRVPKSALVEHRWLKRQQFLYLCGTMDIGLHVSMSETFSIGTADLVTRGVPVVTSGEVPWVDNRYYAEPSDSQSILHRINGVLRAPALNVKRNLKGLARYSDHSRVTWGLFIDTM